MELPNGIPSHDTFWRLFAALKPEQFERCFSEWISAVSAITPGEMVAIDGKFLRRSHDKGLGRGAIDMVSAWACASRLVLAQRKVDEKSNEISAIPELLKILELKGAIVTIDALGCQSEIAETIVEQEADYISSLNASAQRLLDVKRSHWLIENSLHWVLDIAFREDESRLHKRNGAQNFAILRHIALNALKQESSSLGIYNKRLKASRNQDYLLAVLATLFK